MYSVVKVNTKLRGVNQIITAGLPGCSQVPTMLLGAEYVVVCMCQCQYYS